MNYVFCFAHVYSYTSMYINIIDWFVYAAKAQKVVLLALVPLCLGICKLV